MRRAFGFVFAALAGASCGRCGGGQEAAPPAADAEAAEPGEPGPTGAVPSAHRPGRDAEPSVDEARVLDASVVDEQACTGAEIDLTALLFDRRCAIGSSAAKRMSSALEDAAARPVLRQQAKLLGEDRVELRLVNDGLAPVALPLSWHPKVSMFTALAEDEPNRAIYELEAPRLELPEAAAGHTGARFARIVLPPKGVGVARVTVTNVVTKRIAPSCEAGTCAPAKLPPGTYVLHVGELLADVEAGAPAEVKWTVH